MTRHHLTTPLTPATHHPCPGGCGTHVPADHVACKPCWWLLPTRLRLQITNGDRDTKLTATSEALTWFKDNTAGGVPL